jgi:hypothetical protein
MAAHTVANGANIAPRKRLTGRHNLLQEYGLMRAYEEHSKASPHLSFGSTVVSMKKKYFKPSKKGKPKYGGLSNLQLPPPEDLPDLQKILVPFSAEQFAESFKLAAGPMPKKKAKKKAATPVPQQQQQPAAAR